MEVITERHSQFSIGDCVIVSVGMCAGQHGVVIPAPGGVRPLLVGT